MQDHSLGHSGAGGPEVVEHLDLVTAELRRRIAGIGLAIAELREETGRLRASADGRYHAVAVLDRPLDVDPAASVDEPRVASQPTVIEPIIAPPQAPVGSGVAHVEPRVGFSVAEPVSPWSDSPAAVAAPAPAHPPEPTPPPTSAADVAAGETIETVGEAVAPPVVEPTLTWVPEPAPVAVVSPPAADAAPGAVASAVVPAVAPPVIEVAAPVGHAQGAHGESFAEPAPSLWADGDDEDAAAFEAFFSAEIEPEPSQRWLLSD
ncbi:MAG: hypothetical protein ACE367_22075 [Acidimicrobiales bacterium]